LKRPVAGPIIEKQRHDATENPMTQTSNRLFDEMARLMGDAASVAQGVRREAESLFRTQMERFVADMDLVKREEFDVVKEMASKARAENEELRKRIADLEAKLGGGAT
jgi:BMFP domain-containing protein YqiC